jgi:hypothetical protein
MHVKKYLLRLGIALGLLAASAFAIRQGMIWNKTRDVLPEFTPVPEGPRAPPLQHAGVQVGTTTLAEVKQLTAAAGFECRDTSMRGLMQLGRQQAQQKIAEAKEKGDDPDAVSGASRAYYYSKKEQNPQVQWTCENADLSRLDPAFATPNTKQAVTFIFDSDEHPLRYVMTSRKFQSQAATRDARDASIARFAQTLGPPPTQIGKPDERPGEKIFPRFLVVINEWSWVDRRVSVTVMNRGPGSGIDLREVVEVPWPIAVGPTP